VFRKRQEYLDAFICGDDSPARAAFGNIASNLLMKNSGREAILVTSSVPGEGKTTTALNLGASLARSGVKVLLVDANPMSPLLTEALDLGDRPGLAELADGETISEAASEIASLSLDAIGAGRNADVEPAKLFGSQALKKALSEAKSIYDRVILDASAARVARDFLHLSDEIDKIIYVVAPGVVKKGQLARARAEMEKAWDKDVSVLLNRYKEPIPHFLYRLILE
jgi:capsular exopolysaccharide synthesis family protein